jgi:predicted kinase
LKNKIIQWFIENKNGLFNEMKNCEHSHPEGQLSPYHMEGSIWTHTMMVITVIDCMKELTPDEKKILLITALLHDTGKPEAQIEKSSDERGKYYAFHSHEGISTFLATDILHDMSKEFELSSDDIKLILSIISLHGCRVDDIHLNKPKYSNSNYLNFFRGKFRIADKSGAVRANSDKVEGDYEKRKYHKETRKQENKELIIMSGIPCSGKSTYIKENLSEYFLISRDECLSTYVSTLPGKPCKNMNYTEIFRYVHSDDDIERDFNYFFNKFLQDAKSNNKLIIDMTMGSLKSRRSMMNIFGNYNFKSIVMLPKLSTIKKRNSKRIGKIISDSVMDSMIKGFTMPTQNEGFDSVEIIISDKNI